MQGVAKKCESYICSHGTLWLLLQFWILPEKQDEVYCKFPIPTTSITTINESITSEIYQYLRFPLVLDLGFGILYRLQKLSK